jgi:hypothetical protein
VRLLLEVEVLGGDRGKLYDGSSAEQGFWTGVCEKESRVEIYYSSGIS